MSTISASPLRSFLRAHRRRILARALALTASRERNLKAAHATATGTTQPPTFAVSLGLGPVPAIAVQEPVSSTGPENPERAG